MTASFPRIPARRTARLALALGAALLLGPLAPAQQTTAPAAATPSAAPARGVPAHLVGADARWVAHVDVGALFASDLVRGVLAQQGVALDTGEIAEMARAYDLDPGQDLHSITVYGGDEDPQRAVALVAGTVKLQSALDHLIVPMKRTVLDVGGVQLHEWRPRDKGDDDALYTYIARKADTDERLLIASAHRDRVLAALDVVRGSAPSLGAAPHMDLASSPGSLVFASVSEELLRELADDAPPQVAAMVRSLRFELGESSGRTFLDARVTTTSSQQADQLVALIQGGRAFVELAAASEPEAQQVLPLLRQVKVERVDEQIRLRFEHGTPELLALLARLDGRGNLTESDVRATREVPPPRPAGERPAGSTGWR